MHVSNLKRRTAEEQYAFIALAKIITQMSKLPQKQQQIDIILWQESIYHAASEFINTFGAFLQTFSTETINLCYF